MDLIYLLNVLWRKKWIILAVPTISVVAAFFLTMGLKPEYKASTQIATGFTTDEGVSLTNEKFNLRGVDVKFSNLLTSMRSGTIVNMVTYSLAIKAIDTVQLKHFPVKLAMNDLQTVKAFLQKKLSEQSTIAVNEENGKKARAVLNGLGFTFMKFNENLKISRVPNTDYIRITFSSENAEIAAAAVNTYCEEFLRYYVDSKKESSSESVTFVRELMNRKKEELDEKNAALQAFKENNNILGGQPQGDTQVSQVYDLETQRDQINNTLYGSRLKLENYKNALKEKTGGTDVKKSSPNQRVLALKKRIDELNSRFINSGTNNTALLDSLNLLREQYRAELSMMESTGSGSSQGSGMSPSELRDAIASTEIEIQVEESKLEAVTGKLAALRGSLSGYARNEALLNTLEQDAKIASDEYLAAVDKYNEAQKKLLEASGSLRQVYKAAPPASPESSKRIILIALSAIASLGLTVFAIVVLEVADSSIKTTDQYKRKVGLPLAGTLLKVETKKLNLPTIFSAKQTDKSLELFKHFLRKIRYEIENSGGKTFLITSPKVNEGKTFFIFALAFVLSLVKKRVLIIDTNFKNNALTKWLISPKKNQKFIDERSSVYNELQIIEEDNLNGEKEGFEPEKETKDFITSTKYKNIYIIGNSGGVESPEEIFHNKDFATLIEGLKIDFDYILLEGPSLNEFSDSKELIKYIDKIIPVFSAETSIKQLDKDSIDFLKSLNGKLTGAILNKVDLKNLNI